MTKKSSALFPVLFGFFIMGFVDIVGAATHEIKNALELSSTMAGLLPNFIFIWFLVCSIPTGILMKRIGRKRMVQVSNAVTAIGMLVPLPVILGVMESNLAVYLITFALLGIGNTIIQVALNPLLTNVVSGERLASGITMGQFVKALSSLLGPQIILFCTNTLGDWNLTFIIYAGVTLLSMLWLGATKIPREESGSGPRVGFADTFALLRDRFMLRMFVCILLIVGLDVGINFFIPEIFGGIYGHSHPGNMNTVYFGCRALSSFVCAIMLTRMAPRKIFLWTMAVSIAACVVMMALAAGDSRGVGSQALFIAMLLPVAFATANVFSIVFSLALGHMPGKADQISSLLIMGVAGGGVMTLLIGVMNDHMGIVGGMAVLLACMLYIFGVAFRYRGRA